MINKHLLLSIPLVCLLLSAKAQVTDTIKKQPADTTHKTIADTIAKATPLKLDPLKYDSLMTRMANGDATGRWPVKNAPYPLPGAILPFNRIVAYYGNMYSKNMGVLGEYAPKVMISKLQAEVKAWEAADPATPVIPALHYICVTAQAYAGKNGLHNLDTIASILEDFAGKTDTYSDKNNISALKEQEALNK